MTSSRCNSFNSANWDRSKSLSAHVFDTTSASSVSDSCRIALSCCVRASNCGSSSCLPSCFASSQRFACFSSNSFTCRCNLSLDALVCSRCLSFSSYTSWTWRRNLSNLSSASSSVSIRACSSSIACCSCRMSNRALNFSFSSASTFACCFIALPSIGWPALSNCRLSSLISSAACCFVAWRCWPKSRPKVSMSLRSWSRSRVKFSNSRDFELSLVWSFPTLSSFLLRTTTVSSAACSWSWRSCWLLARLLILVTSFAKLSRSKVIFVRSSCSLSTLPPKLSSA